MPLLSWIKKTEFSEVLTKLINVFLNDIGEGYDFMSSLKLFHSSWEKCVIKVNCSWGSLFYNILYCGFGLVDGIVVESPGIRPDWLFVNNWFWTKKLKRASKISLSNILLNIFFFTEISIYTINIKTTVTWYHDYYECQEYKKGNN